MNTFSEKSMEEAIVNNPKEFINEKGLRLLARQYRVGSYIFDLLFEDRHGGKLIANIVPPERKKRLNDLGVDYKEVPESIFITDQSEITEKISENEYEPVSL